MPQVKVIQISLANFDNHFRDPAWIYATISHYKSKPIRFLLSIDIFKEIVVKFNALRFNSCLLQMIIYSSSMEAIFFSNIFDAFVAF